MKYYKLKRAKVTLSMGRDFSAHCAAWCYYWNDFAIIVIIYTIICIISKLETSFWVSIRSSQNKSRLESVPATLLASILHNQSALSKRWPRGASCSTIRIGLLDVQKPSFTQGGAKLIAHAVPGNLTSAQPAFYVPTIRNSWDKAECLPLLRSSIKLNVCM